MIQVTCAINNQLFAHLCALSQLTDLNLSGIGSEPERRGGYGWPSNNHSKCSRGDMCHT